jgi:general secretion pathway protein G
LKALVTDDDGYTLTEMLVVIGIISLIAAVLTPGIISQMSRARAKAAHLQLDTVSAAVEMFYADTGRYPSSQEGLGALLTPPQDAPGWSGPYVRDRKALADPWGRPLAYSQPDKLHYQVLTLGADGKLGGVGVNADMAAPETISP